MTSSGNAGPIRPASYDEHCATFPQVEGASALIGLYGAVPCFHDSEITDLNLRTNGGSTLRLRNPFPTIFDSGSIFVTFEVAKLVDVVLEGFNGQNVLGSLYTRPARPYPDRASFHLPLVDGDLELELDPSVGLGGRLVCRGVKVSWTMDRRARAATGRGVLPGQ